MTNFGISKIKLQDVTYDRLNEIISRYFELKYDTFREYEKSNVNINKITYKEFLIMMIHLMLSIEDFKYLKSSYNIKLHVISFDKIKSYKMLFDSKIFKGTKLYNKSKSKYYVSNGWTKWTDL